MMIDKDRLMKCEWDEREEEKKVYIKSHNIIKRLTKLMAKKKHVYVKQNKRKKCEKGISTCYP